jgi:hypothetical protein
MLHLLFDFSTKGEQMFKIITEFVNDEAHCTVPVGSPPIVRPVEIAVDHGGVQVDVDGLSAMVTMFNGSISVSVLEGEDFVEVYGKDRQQREHGRG